jgi:hypothetical protein
MPGSEIDQRQVGGLQACGVHGGNGALDAGVGS